MAYSELIKNFERIRGYMRQFYVYGFKNRRQYGEKSARSYDNERRRVESWLGDYMAFRREESGKQVFLSVDSRSVERNPLHDAFRAKSFTDKDITLHFYMLDRLQPGRELTVAALAEQIDEYYLTEFPEAEPVDISTLRKKLKEYESLGLLCSRKQGKELLYSRTSDSVDLALWEDALRFYTEAEPLGVVGSFLLDRLGTGESPFRFKHHYLLHTLDSEVLYQLLEAIREKQSVKLTLWTTSAEYSRTRIVTALKIYISVQSGRQYLLCRTAENNRFLFFRVDTIHSVQPLRAASVPCPEKDLEAYQTRLWGVSDGDGNTVHHIEMDVAVAPGEGYIVQRLLREKRCGRVDMVEDGLWRFQADVYDPREMLPWLRTFIGRIVRLECSDEGVTERFYNDLSAMAALYGGDAHAVS